MDHLTHRSLLMYVVKELCPFSLNEAHCGELCAVPVSGETVHHGIKCRNEGIALNLIFKRQQQEK